MKPHPAWMNDTWEYTSSGNRLLSRELECVETFRWYGLERDLRALSSANPKTPSQILAMATTNDQTLKKTRRLQIIRPEQQTTIGSCRPPRVEESPPFLVSEVKQEGRPVEAPRGKGASAAAGPKSPDGMIAKELTASVPDMTRVVARDLAAECTAHTEGEDQKAARMAELVVLEKEESEKLLSRMGTLAAGTFVGISWHSCVPGDLEAPYAQVSRNPDTLIKPFFPFRWCEIVGSEFTPAQKKVLVGTKLVTSSLVVQQPAIAELALSPGAYYTLNLRVAVHHVGFLGREVLTEEEEVSFCWEQWTRAATDRICSTPSFERNLTAAQRWRTSHRGFPANDDTYGANRLVDDQAFVALMMARDVSMRQILAIAADAFKKESNLRIMRLFMSADETAPIAAGHYLEGYNVCLKDIFPQQWAQAVDAFKVSGDLKAATQVFINAAAKVNSFVAGRSRDICKTLAYCRALPAQIHTSPGELLRVAFPDPKNPMNQLAGVFKRLLSSNEADQEGDTNARQNAIADVFVERARIETFGF
jgi:ribosomal protein S8E